MVWPGQIFFPGYRIGLEKFYYKQLFALDCKAMQMAQVDIELPEGRYTHECAMVYDPSKDMCVALIPSRFSGPMQTFLYRFDPASAGYR